MKRYSISLFLVLCLLILAPGRVSAQEGLALVVRDQAELIDALNRSEKVASIEIAGSFTITEDCTIRYTPELLPFYSDVVVTVDENVTLTIGEGGVFGSFWPSYEGDWEDELQPDGKVINNGTIEVLPGGALQAGFTRNNGVLLVRFGGMAVCAEENFGTVTVYPGGAYRTSQGRDVVNHGSIYIMPEGELESRFGSTIINAEDGKLTIDGTFVCNCALSYMWFRNEGTVGGIGDVIVQKADPAFETDLEDALGRMMAELGQTARFERWDDLFIFKREIVSSEEELASLLDESKTRTVGGETCEELQAHADVLVVLTQDMTITGSIRSMARITVPEGVTLTVAEGASLEAGLTIEPKAEVLVRGGTLGTTMGGMIDVGGRLIVKEDGQLISQMGGSVIVREAGELVLDGTFFCGGYHEEESDIDIVWFRSDGKVTGFGKVVSYMLDSGEALTALEDRVNNTDITVRSESEAYAAAGLKVFNRYGGEISAIPSDGCMITVTVTHKTPNNVDWLLLYAFYDAEGRQVLTVFQMADDPGVGESTEVNYYLTQPEGAVSFKVFTVGVTEDRGLVPLAEALVFPGVSEK